MPGRDEGRAEALPSCSSAARGPRRGLAQPLTAVLNVAPTDTLGTSLAATGTVSPVRGLRAVVAGFETRWKVRNPVRAILSPLVTPATTTSSNAFSTAAAVVLSVPADAATWSTSSALVMLATANLLVCRGNALRTVGARRR